MWVEDDSGWDVDSSSVESGGVSRDDVGELPFSLL